MPTRNVLLTDRQEEIIDALVQSGRYQNASEVLRDGLRMVEDREVAEATKHAALRVATKVGTDALDRGAFHEFADASSLATHLNSIADQVLDKGLEPH